MGWERGPEQPREFSGTVLCYARSFTQRRNEGRNAGPGSYGEESDEGTHGKECLEGKDFSDDERNESKLRMVGGFRQN